MWSSDNSRQCNVASLSIIISFLFSFKSDFYTSLDNIFGLFLQNHFMTWIYLITWVWRRTTTGEDRPSVLLAKTLAGKKIRTFWQTIKNIFILDPGSIKGRWSNQIPQMSPISIKPKCQTNCIENLNFTYSYIQPKFHKKISSADLHPEMIFNFAEHADLFEL